MTPRENAMAVLNREQPDYYFDLMDSLQLLPDPVLMRDYPPQDGQEHPDSWGTVYIFLPGAPGAHPHVTRENAVIKDIEKWQEQLKVPSVKNLDWSAAKQVAADTDRKEKFVGIMFGGGLFERSHHLMGMQEALMAYLEYPDEMYDLLGAIKEYKIAYIEEMAKQVHPDIIFYHDDWGSKQNLFLPPRVWREIIKPHQIEIAQAIHDNGMIYMHHADCICQPIVEDMLEIGIDIWQGAIAQNDIVKIQEITKGQLPMVGGIDGPKIDVDGISDEAIRAEVRRAFDTYCPGGRFFPSIPNGVCFIPHNNEVYRNELETYGRIYAQEHPIEHLKQY